MLNSSNHLLKLHGIDFLSERIYTQILLDSIIVKLYITYIHTGGVSNDTPNSFPGHLTSIDTHIAGVSNDTPSSFSGHLTSSYLFARASPRKI